ncbi:hypothetical protein VQ7734_05031 [Vibrio quintilis]|uniref:Uncharacterized protein n=1 Tax=Vibrio quintilis TaxID=1117707 RepID=A0A1M7Z2Y8_9VIBR|nr:hypothetical protein VQ7734_05031 [Vibrio quintilis]
MRTDAIKAKMMYLCRYVLNHLMASQKSGWRRYYLYQFVRRESLDGYLSGMENQWTKLLSHQFVIYLVDALQM